MEIKNEGSKKNLFNSLKTLPITRSVFNHDHIFYRVLTIFRDSPFSRNPENITDNLNETLFYYKFMAHLSSAIYIFFLINPHVCTEGKSLTSLFVYAQTTLLQELEVELLCVKDKSLSLKIFSLAQGEFEKYAQEDVIF